MIRKVPYRYEEKYIVFHAKTKKKQETVSHILECKALNDKNDKISYIPTFNDLYNEEIEEQAYVSMIIKENMKIREALKL